MKYADYYDCDICNGESVGMSLFISGCPIHCKDCFNPELWDFNVGYDWTPKVEEKFLNKVGREYIKRVSVLGGSPLCPDNVIDVEKLIEKIKMNYPEKQIWVYTGYTWEHLLTANDSTMEVLKARNNIIRYIDVLVDGAFECANKDITLGFRGSTNQRIIDVQKTLKLNHVVLLNVE